MPLNETPPHEKYLRTPLDIYHNDCKTYAWEPWGQSLEGTLLAKSSQTYWNNSKNRLNSMATYRLDTSWKQIVNLLLWFEEEQALNAHYIIFMLF